MDLPSDEMSRWIPIRRLKALDLRLRVRDCPPADWVFPCYPRVEFLYVIALHRPHPMEPLSCHSGDGHRFIRLWAQAGETTAMLRIACDGPSANADVSINGVFKGQYPVGRRGQRHEPAGLIPPARPDRAVGRQECHADWYRKAHDQGSGGAWDRLRELGLFYILKTK